MLGDDTQKACDLSLRCAPRRVGRSQRFLAGDLLGLRLRQPLRRLLPHLDASGGEAVRTARVAASSVLRSAKGMVRICLTRDPDNFPQCVGDADAIKKSVPARVAAAEITGLSPGTYAIAVIHDENANSKLDKFAGIPREGIGFSRNPSFTFGPPEFAAARFLLKGDADRQQVRMRYFL